VSYLEAIWLGILQGLTEFLPISSSGHLSLMQHFLGVEESGVFFEVMLHLGTLGAVVAVYWQDLTRLVKAALAALIRADTYRAPRQAFRDSEDLRLIGLIVLGTIPTGLIGVLGKEPLESLFERPMIVAGLLAVTGFWLLLPGWFGPRDPAGSVSPGRAVVIGVVQGLAIMPGISRSGSTISTGLLLGIEPSRAARFSFLLSIPAILGAVVLQAGELSGVTTSAGHILAGFVAAFVVGYLALRLLLRMLDRGRFAVFSYYCFALAAATLVALTVGGR